ncbi:MAG: serine/threonine-protein phosphatase [Acidimicrobiia bacterium]|nr:serine/threonine-protein phosphatase [Acidimicrobiia bacterium]
MASNDPAFDLRDLLAAVESAPPAAAAEAVAVELARRLGAVDVNFWIADYSGRSVVRAERRPGAPAEHPGGHMPLDDGPWGAALQSQAVQVVADAGQHHIYVPVTNRGDAVGVLELIVDAVPSHEVLRYLAAAGRAVAYVVAANRQFTDLYEWGMRTTHFTLPAEIQRRLLPSAFSCEAGPVTIAAWLEPSHDIGGDTFDYSVDLDTVHLSITDAVGHELEGAMLATLLVGALRNGRRRDLDLAAQAANANTALRLHAKPHQFVTGQLVRIDLASETALIVNAGHPLPFRLRGGEVTELALDADMPFGISPTAQRVQRLDLEPGDRFVFVTDGMLERNAARVELPDIIRATAQEHAREAVHRMTSAVVDAVGGDLRDDATVVCLDWHGAGQ